MLPSDLKRERFRHKEVSTVLLQLSNRHREAMACAVEGQALAEQIAPGSTLISQILRLRADCHIALCEFTEACIVSEQALAVAQKLNERVEIAACWRVFAQVAAHDGKDDEAREWYRKAIELFGQISSRYELAVTRYLAACSGIFEQTEGIALLYLAKEYFESEQVTPYLCKVESTLDEMHNSAVMTRPVRPSRDGKPVEIIATSSSMRNILELAHNIAPSNMDVLLTGETGTGKDLMARYIHEHSGCEGQFVSQNVATLPDSMVEAELFGHRKGAYTGAAHERKGLIKYAEHGTLFLNEIGEASMELQTKLLEVLETRRIRRMGENHDQPVEFRLIAATNADLAECVRSGKFRADLYHRLNQATITLPPLRERTDDIAPLVDSFLAGFGYIGHSEKEVGELINVLVRHNWPGNVRELENMLRRLWVVTNGNLSRMTETAEEEFATSQDDRLASVLAECGGNQRKAARRLGIGESTLRYRMKKRSE